MKLNLKRPIVFFDLETTGVDTAKDRIVEISMVKVMPDGEQIVKTRKLNPGMHIPAEATAIHGITDEDVRDCPTFAQVAKSLEQFIRGCDFGGFNSNRFDLPVLVSTRGEAADYAGRILFNEKGEEVFGFGKYKGRPVAEVFRAEPSYYAWMMNGDFPLYTKKVITEIRMREKTK